MTRKEAINKVYGMIGTAEQHEALEFLVPEVRELRESYERQVEDERIRKTLIHIVKGACDKYGIKYKGDEITEEKLLAYLEKLKEQKSNVLQNAFDKSKKDYTLEEKSKASDYAESILPTSVMYGESEEEYKLHTIIEAAFIAGQKEQKPIPANSVGLKEQKPVELDEYTKTNLDRALQIIKKAKGTLQGYQSDDGIYECDKAIECLEHFLYRGLEIEKSVDLINSLQQEQPEVDLEKEVRTYCLSSFRFNYDELNDSFYSNAFEFDDVIELASHFYELGIKARKEK